jgi:hypothetical protein
MKSSTIYDLFNHRKSVSHLVIFCFSFFAAVILSLTNKLENSAGFQADVFVMLFAQLEVFIYLGNRLFANVSFDRSPAEITKVVLVRFSIFLTLCLIVSMVLFIVLQYAGLVISGGNASNVIYDFFHTGFNPWFKSTITGLSIGAVIFIILMWQSSLKREQKLREENLIFQNETLRNQINPHFLFNSLNTLSALVVTQPDAAEIFIHRLSSIYRYILENSSRNKVPLSVELAFIGDYFYLHKIRDDGKIRMEIQIEQADKFEILPVSLQILVENAIKHDKATRESPLLIRIYLEANYIVVSNNLQKMAARLESTEIGLKNLAQRVNLVSGRTLIVEETPANFIVKIPLF